MAEIKNPNLRKLIIIGLILLGIIPIAILIYVKYQTDQAYQESMRSSRGAEDSYSRLKSAMEPPPSTHTYKVGEKIDLGDHEITVFKLEPYSEPEMKRVYGVAKGQAIDVLIENTGNRSFMLFPSHFKMQDQEGRALDYYNVNPGGKRPALPPFSNLVPGQKVRAYITFIGEGKPVVIYYQSPQGQTAKIALE
jgi:hypothetical protein